MDIIEFRIFETLGIRYGLINGSDINTFSTSISCDQYIVLYSIFVSFIILSKMFYTIEILV